MKKVLLFLLIAFIGMKSWGQIVWSNASTATAWFTNTNWNPNTSATAWLTTDIAQFQNAGTATTAGINMNTSGIAGTYSIGAIEITSARTRALTINNSASSKAGVLTLNGATINSISNIILRNNSGSMLAFTGGSGGSQLGIGLGNATNNVIEIDDAGGITIGSIISGSNNLTKAGSGAGVLSLTAANTYTGTTTVNGGTLQLNNTGGGTLPSANSVTVNSGGTLQISSNQTLNNVTLASGATLIVDASATLTITGTLTQNSATITNNGNIVITPNAYFLNTSGVSNVTLQQTFVGQRGWRVLANPFTTATTIATVASGNNIAISTTPSGASGLTDSRTYDNSANAAVTDWANVTASSWAANTAYALFYRGTNAEVTGNSYTSGPAGQTYSVSGTLNGATTTITPLVGDGTSFNLIGNPYAAPVTTQALTGGVAAPYTVYQISVSGDGRTKNGGWVASLTSSTSNTIPVLGVIAYQPSNTTPFNVTPSNINTGGTLQTGLFGAATTIKNLELIVNNSNGEYQDKLFVRTGTDKNKLSKFANDNVNFYTVNGNNERLAIDSREQLSGTIPLGINGLAGSYILNVANNNLENVTVYLKDKLTNTQTELTPGTNYNFEITGDAATKGEGRFELQFVSKAMATLPTNNTSGGFTAKVLGNVITNNQPIQVQVQNASANAVIQVKDVNGRAIATQAAVNGLNTINVSRASLGMYIVQTTDGNNVITDKVIKQ